MFFIKVGSRRLPIADVTANPTSTWVTQQARNLAIDEAFSNARYQIRDRDAKYTTASDTALATADARVMRTPVRTPAANAYAKRVIQTMRRDCLDWLLAHGRRHLEHILDVYAEHDNSHRPHLELGLAPPDHAPPERTGPLEQIGRAHV